MDKTCNSSRHNRFRRAYKKAFGNNKTFKNIEKVELLPYHTMGVQKYDKMGLEYRLSHLKPMDKEKANSLQK